LSISPLGDIILYLFSFYLFASLVASAPSSRTYQALDIRVPTAFSRGTVKIYRRLKKTSKTQQRETMASAFASIANQRVSAQRPPRQSPELDFERCAALHNTISIYGWLRSGRKVADMDRKTWWMKHGSKTLEVLLRPSLVRYLKKIFDLPGGDGSHFFYYISRLAKPREMLYLGDLLNDGEKKIQGEKHRFITLYLTNKELVSQRSGIV
jgi:hypothetical protein